MTNIGSDIHTYAPLSSHQAKEYIRSRWGSGSPIGQHLIAALRWEHIRGTAFVPTSLAASSGPDLFQNLSRPRGWLWDGRDEFLSAVIATVLALQAVQFIVEDSIRTLSDILQYPLDGVASNFIINDWIYHMIDQAGDPRDASSNISSAAIEPNWNLFILGSSALDDSNISRSSRGKVELDPATIARCVTGGIMGIMDGESFLIWAI